VDYDDPVTLVRLAAGALACALAIITGCVTLPRGVERVPSHGVSDTQETVLARAAVAALREGGPSGFRIMAAGDVAYSSRLVLTEDAQRSLDLQYYWVASDPSTRLNISSAADFR
jgi:putative cardiolipin synthase